MSGVRRADHATTPAAGPRVGGNTAAAIQRDAKVDTKAPVH